MVLKIIQLSTIEAAKWFAAAVVISTFIWSVGGFLAITLWTAYREDIIATAGLATSDDIAELKIATSNDIAELKTALDDAAVSFVQLSRQIVVLSRPDQIALYREPPRAIGGHCTAGQNCVISVFAERSQRALDCRILGPRTELLILSNGREYIATPVIGRQVVNLQSGPRALEPTFTLPQGIPAGEASAVIRSYYTECGWQVDGQPPAIQDSPVFDLEIRR